MAGEEKYTGSAEDQEKLRYLRTDALTGQDQRFVKKFLRYAANNEGRLTTIERQKLAELQAGSKENNTQYDNVSVDQLDLSELSTINTPFKVFCMYWYPKFFAVPEDAKACVETQMKNGAGYSGIAKAAKARIQKLKEEQEDSKEDKKSEEKENKTEEASEDAEKQGTPAAVEATVKPKKNAGQQAVEDAVKENPTIVTPTQKGDSVSETQNPTQNGNTKENTTGGSETVRGQLE